MNERFLWGKAISTFLTSVVRRQDHYNLPLTIYQLNHINVNSNSSTNKVRIIMLKSISASIEIFWIKQLTYFISLCMYSSVTIPVTLDSFQKNKLVEKNFARFLLPVGTITYVPTTAIYIALAAIFIIQTSHSNLMTITSCILIW